MCRRLLYLVPLVLVLSLAPMGKAQIEDGSLAAWWRLDEGSGTSVSDASGGGNDGTLTGGAEWTEGISKRGVYLDGVDDFIGVPNVLGEAGTVAFWFKPDWDGTDPEDYRLFDASLGGIYFFISKGANHADINPEEFGFYLEDAADADYQAIEFDPAGVIFADTWFHVAVTWEFGGGPAILYFNGEEMARADSIGGFPNLDPVLRFGLETYAYIPSANGANGVIDEIMIYSRALAAEEIPLIMVTAPAELASDPRPAHEATDVPRDVILSWVSGEYAVQHDVYFGTAFEDVNTASRTNTLGTLISEGQTAETYDTGRLELGQTYYWRIDEVNGAPDNTIFKGDVWNFTVEPLAYPVRGIMATSNASSDPGLGPEKTVDGSGINEEDQHSTASGDMWLGVPSGADPVYVQYEFDRVYKLHEMLVWNYNSMFELLLGFGLKDVTIEYSENGTDWAVLGDFELAQATARADYATNTTIDFGGMAVKYVKLTVNAGWGAMPQYGLSEVRFLYIPAHTREPEPADGAANVSVETALAWRAGRDAVSHEVHFGTDAEALPLADTVSTNSYVPGTLDLATTYYWQVTAVQEAESWEGSLWSFVTQDYLVVDDFESYDDEDNRIYDTWLDGWVNETGSTVGHLEAPFAEQTIVNGGSQSMPLFYDNAGFTTSEADFELAQNWAASGIRSLSLYFQGDPANTGGQLYVKINNTRVDYDGDAADLNRTMWQPWNIDLSTAGNVSNVSSLTIGVEGAGASGVVYIDDIRLYPLAPQFIVPTEPDAANLVAQYSFDGNANDGSGNGHNGTPVGDITFVSDPVRGQVVSLPGG
ncbi:MAG: LamG domain-containing protein, partial [Phycisphaerales bacterium]